MSFHDFFDLVLVFALHGSDDCIRSTLRLLFALIAALL